MGNTHPCDLCLRRDCYECFLNIYSSQYYCATYGCALNYDGNCLAGAYDYCGAWEG